MEQDRKHLNDYYLMETVMPMEADDLIRLMDEATVQGLSLCDYIREVLAERAEGLD